MASSSKYEQHHLFHQWVLFNQDRFLALLRKGERACCEWLAQAHGTRYNLPHEPLVILDLMNGDARASFAELAARVSAHGFVTPCVLNHGRATSIEAVRKQLDPSGHGALDPVEGAVWRAERQGRFDFLAKWVRPDKMDGCYLPKKRGENPLWNWRPEW